MQVYEKVREYVNLHGLRQESVADAAGIPNVTFNALLNGKRKMYAEDLRAICIALGVSADIFIELKTA
jgi:transcriptional regulator with XRE-family HTH domain